MLEIHIELSFFICYNKKKRGLMSTLYFESKTTSTEIPGRERSVLNNAIELSLSDALSKITKTGVLNKTSDFNNYLFIQEPEEEFKKQFSKALLNSFDVTYFNFENEKLNSYELIGNTAFATKKESVKFATIIHYLCESHIYVLPENFKWFKGILTKALSEGVLTKQVGWEDLLNDLDSATSPIVTYFSGGNEFPNQSLSDLNGEEWEGLNNSEQFDLSLDKIKEEKLLELTPSTWDDYIFGKGSSLYDL